MTEVEPALAEDRKAVREFAAQAQAVPPGRWSTPRAEGKWSAAQVAEHVAKAYERSCEMLRGDPQPGMPRWLRPLLRILFLTKVLRTGRFPKGAKSPEQFLPSPEPLPLEASLARIEKASADFAAEARKRAEPGLTIDHPVFGRIRVADYVRLNQIHTRHHLRQLS
ncbi:MAG: DUF1569 domain-containing protein [Planctomycetes bacterium]|nr:DUF1569 domain-containing protein [Planctomycetota bacterium]